MSIATSRDVIAGPQEGLKMGGGAHIKVVGIYLPPPKVKLGLTETPKTRGWGGARRSTLRQPCIAKFAFAISIKTSWEICAFTKIN